MASKSFSLTVKTIYFYFFAGLGLVLLVVGIFQLSDWAVKSFLLPKYSLQYEDTRCDYIPAKAESEPSELSSVPPSQTKEECLVRLDEDRKNRQVTDMARSITFMVVGVILFIFHFRRTSLFEK